MDSRFSQTDSVAAAAAPAERAAFARVAPAGLSAAAEATIHARTSHAAIAAALSSGRAPADPAGGG
jgi:hypothetical protein